MTRNAISASDYFEIPPKRVVEPGREREVIFRQEHAQVRSCSWLACWSVWV